MFDIEYKGANSVVISTKKSKLLTDPRLSLVGLKDIWTKNAVELATESRFSINDPESQLSIEGPGEYEIGDFAIRGIPARRHVDSEDQGLLSTIYRIDIGDARVALLGNIADNLSEAQLEMIGVVDIAVLPVGGGGYTLDHVSAARIARQINPKIIIPVHYAEPGIHYEVPQDSLELFTKELGAPVESTPKYRFKSGAALPDVMSVVVVQRG